MKYLMRMQAYWALVVLLIVLLVGLELAELGAISIDVTSSVPLKQGVDTVELVRRSHVVTFVQICLTVPLWFLLLHHLRKDIWRYCVRSYQHIIIMICVVVHEFSNVTNRVGVGISAGVMTYGWVVNDLSRAICIYIPYVFFVANIDALMLPRIAKLIVVLITMADWVWSYVDLRLYSLEWGHKLHCWDEECPIYQAGCVATSGLIVAYLAEFAWAYFCGHDFASIISHYGQRANLSTAVVAARPKPTAAASSVASEQEESGACVNSRGAASQEAVLPSESTYGVVADCDVAEDDQKVLTWAPNPSRLKTQSFDYLS